MALSAKHREVLNALRTHGDTLTHPREIVHWAYFPTIDLRAHFVEQGLEAGFKLDGTSEPNDESPEFRARLAHIDIPNEDVIERITNWLSSLAQRCGGEYDGWETQVIWSPSP